MVNEERDGPEDTLVLADPYEIVSIRAVSAPTGTAGADWHRYEISQGVNRIVGYRSGGIDSVTEAIESIVIRLNQRRKNRRGRVHVIIQSQSKAKSMSPIR
jgi:hypothetical protein